jgi:hypothetical protein
MTDKYRLYLTDKVVGKLSSVENAYQSKTVSH